MNFQLNSNWIDFKRQAFSNFFKHTWFQIYRFTDKKQITERIECLKNAVYLNHHYAKALMNLGQICVAKA